MLTRFIWAILISGSASAQTPATKSAPAPPASVAGCVIRMNTVGPIHAGMTVRAAKQVLPGTVFKQTNEVGGSTIAFFAVTRGSKRVMDLYPDQEDGIKETSKIELIRVYDPDCSTEAGVHAGMPLIAVEGKYGNLKKLIVEQSEKREYAQFEKLPSWLEIQAGSGDAGIYDAGELCTTRYKSSANVESLWVSHENKNKLLDDDQFCKAPEKPQEKK